MLIDCPWCGPRSVEEFTYRGDGTLKRPALSDRSIDAANAYVYDRENPAGDHMEIWHHGNGCRSHILVKRNTLTHKILSCELLGPYSAGRKK